VPAVESKPQHAARVRWAGGADALLAPSGARFFPLQPRPANPLARSPGMLPEASRDRYLTAERPLGQCGRSDLPLTY
jgi:hypothetical protein